MFITFEGKGLKRRFFSWGVVRRFDLTPVCYCGEKAITRIAITAKNRGRKFWGCPKFKGGSEEFVGCNFFSWCSENVLEERCGPTKNDDDSDDTATKMVERDDQSKLIKTKMVEREGESKLINIEKSIMSLEK
ncbi:hypothetical protein DEO72_LG10g2382 [Vigna unguiculata]|uniref:GRF-type domain-containing protein n=1 Tax=Vigna unguiculata TaxID=3917 RepID=A0A4D6NF54_VIGUN|nr:hypothetical protein DEO72_LG10g2382 [Vigna unguiculata]